MSIDRMHESSPYPWAPNRHLIARSGLAMVALIACLSVRGDDESESKGVKQLRAVYAKDAAEYQIYRDSELREKLELLDRPVYVWTNAVRRQYGSVFLWTWRGRPEAIGSVFTFPAQVQGMLGVMHEFHSLSNSVLIPRRGDTIVSHWQPETGLLMKRLPDAPIPADSPRNRLSQMKDLSRRFTASSIDTQREPWELRMLTQPLFRYQSTDPKVIDGGLFAFLTSAGTDPEILLLLEARTSDSGAEWYYATCRFSSSDLTLKYQGNVVWTSIIDEENTRQHDPKHLYSLHRDRRIDDVVSQPTEPQE